MARFDLSLVVEEADDSLGAYRATFEYATALFEPETIARLSRRFEAFLVGLADGLTTPLASVQLAGPEDLADVRSWNRTDCDYGAFVPVYALVAAQVDSTPDAVALT